MGNRVVDIQKVFAAYAGDLRMVEQEMARMFQSDAVMIPTIGAYIIRSGGKRMRPLFLLASAALAGYRGPDATRLAAVVETLHTASLLHDDVVDGADFRRGLPSANSQWGNQVVVLAGDYLYSKAVHASVTFKNHKINDALAWATTMMTRGELKQLERSTDINITEAEYFEIISAKTGALISASSRIGAILAGVDQEKEDAIGEFGLMIGNAFQVADDILDYRAEESEFGKRLGKDLEEGKVTLPLICLLRAASEAEREEISRILKSEAIAESALMRIGQLMQQYNAIEDAQRRARSLVDEAKARLSVFPDCQEREHLYDIAEYSLMRVK